MHHGLEQPSEKLQRALFHCRPGADPAQGGVSGPGLVTAMLNQSLVRANVAYIAVCQAHNKLR